MCLSEIRPLGSAFDYRMTFDCCTTAVSPSTISALHYQYESITTTKTPEQIFFFQGNQFHAFLSSLGFLRSDFGSLDPVVW
jgi:hypothetical protein